MITDKNKAPKNLHYNVSNNSGSINKISGKEIFKPPMILRKQ